MERLYLIRWWDGQDFSVLAGRPEAFKLFGLLQRTGAEAIVIRDTLTGVLLDPECGMMERRDGAGKLMFFDPAWAWERGEENGAKRG